MYYLALFLLIATVAAKDWTRVCTASGNRVVRSATAADEENTSDSGIFPYNIDLSNMVNLQINSELSAFYSYMNAAYYFERETQDMPGMAKFFHDASAEELKHAQLLMKYQVKRGGSLNFEEVTQAEKDLTFSTLREAIEWALNIEKAITKEILCLIKEGNEENDSHLVDFLESKLLPEQYQSMKVLTSHNKTLSRIMHGASQRLAEYQFDMITLEGNKYTKPQY